MIQYARFKLQWLQYPFTVWRVKEHDQRRSLLNGVDFTDDDEVVEDDLEDMDDYEEVDEEYEYED